jgi:hypothetical protein
MDRERRYWFPTKRVGWGWGAPATWQGWCVLLVFLALVLVDVFFVMSRYGQVVFYIVLAILVACLGFVCWRTGEPPRWRSGGE